MCADHRRGGLLLGGGVHPPDGLRRARGGRPASGVHEGKLPEVAEHLGDAREDLLAFTAFPDGGSGPTTSPSDSTERSAAGPKSWESSTGRDSLVRLIGAVLAEQTDEWAEGRRYLGLEGLSRCRLALPDAATSSTTEVTTDPLMSLPA